MRPPVSPLPALAAGFVTFGCFNNPTKIGPQVIAVWAEILRRLPQSRVVLKYKGIDDITVAGRLAAEFAGHGIDRSGWPVWGGRPTRNCWPSTTTSIWPSIRFPITAA